MFSFIGKFFNKEPQVEIETPYQHPASIEPQTLVDQTAGIIKGIAELQPKFMPHIMESEYEVRCFHVRLPSLLRGPGHRDENHAQFKHQLELLVNKAVANLTTMKADRKKLSPVDVDRQKLDDAIDLLSQNITGTLKTALRPVGVKDMTVRRYLKEDNSRIEKVEELLNAAKEFQKDSPKEGPASSSG